MVRRGLHIWLAFLVVFPVLILIWKVPLSEANAAWVGKGWELTLLRSLLQSFLSACSSVLIGSLLSLGLLSLRSGRLHTCFSVFLLLPVFLPQLVVASSVVYWFFFIDLHWFGLPGVVVAHTITNAGLVAVLVDQYTRSSLSGSLLVSQVMGSSQRQQLWRVWLPQVWPRLSTLFLLVFAFCIMSFVSPLLISPTEPWSLEVLIFEMLRSSDHYKQAIYLSIYQSVIVLALAWWLVPAKEAPNSGESYPFRFRMPWLLSIGIAIFIFLFVGLGTEFLNASSSLKQTGGLFVQEWSVALMGSVQVGLVAVLMTFCLLVVTVLARPTLRLHRFLTGFVPLSPVVLAFSLWMLGGNNGSLSVFKIGLGVSILYFPLLYRWKLGGQLQSLQSQALVAKSLGASDLLIFKRVYWPQCAATVIDLTSVLSMWAVGDLVMVAVLGFRSGGTLPQLVQTMLTSYRPELAALTTVSLLGLGLLFVLVIQLLFAILFPNLRRPFVTG